MADRSAQLQKILEGFHTFKACLVSHRRAHTHGFSITSAQWLVVGFVARQTQASIKDISTALSITSSAATQLVNELVKSGHLEKRADPRDARATVITLSRATKTRLSTMQRTALAEMGKLFSVLTDKEFAQYITLNEKLLRHCKK